MKKNTTILLCISSWETNEKPTIKNTYAPQWHAAKTLFINIPKMC
jgi:hypothetical protein